MTVWWFTLISTFCIDYIAVKTQKKSFINENTVRYYPNFFFSVISCVILIIVSGFRESVGDTVPYRNSYENSIPATVSEYLKNSDFEGDWGFNLFQAAIKQLFGKNGQWLILICSIITISLIFYTFYRYSDSLELAIFYFIASGSYMTSMNGVRQYLVSAILFIAFPWIIKKKWYLYIPLVLIVSTMHKSALIFILLYFIVNAQAWGKVTKGILIVGIFLYISYPVTGPLIVRLLGDSQYGQYGSLLLSNGRGANFLRVIVFAVPIFIAFLGRKKEIVTKKSEYNLMINMSVLNLVFILLANRYWIYARFNMYFTVYAIILLCWGVKYLCGRYRQVIYAGSLVAYAFYFWYETYVSLGFDHNYVHFITSWS